MRETAKNNSPSPCSYKVSEALEKASGERFQNKSGRFYKLPKSKRNMYTETVVAWAKKLPGVGQYQNHIALDKVARPMKTRGY